MISYNEKIYSEAEIDEFREAIFMVIDEHGLRADDGHWITEDELYEMSETEVLVMFMYLYA